MRLQEKLPISYLLFTTRGRINRLQYWLISIFIWTTFYSLFVLISFLFSPTATYVLYPLLAWALWATASKRLHDANKSANWLWLIALPVIGPFILILWLGFRKGSVQSNRFGAAPGSAPDYFQNPLAEEIPHLKTSERIVNDITQLNPVIVQQVERPSTIQQLQDLIRNTDLPISIGGGRFSMGGQTASSQSLHIDMRSLRRIVDFNPEAKTIRVEAGIRWCDIQQHIDPYDLSISIMQTYANFTVGGSLSVNAHGRYMGAGPLILSVRSITVLLINGEIKTASPTLHSELFYACIGAYHAVGIIVEVELSLTDNVAVKRIQRKMSASQYKEYFTNQIRHQADIIFHNGDLYPPHYKNIRAVSWVKTDEKPTVKTRLMPLAAAYPLERYFIGAFSKSNFGKWRREYIIDPIVYARKKIHWRNYEAGYDVRELEPNSRKESTYVLQEYFVPVNRFDEFVEGMRKIFTTHQVNVINVSVRHAKADSGSLLAWAREEVFAFVVYYKQGTQQADQQKVAQWTREMIDWVLTFDGAYYLPYQPHATGKQFHAAYPQAQQLFVLKQKLDPQYRLRNILWDQYYKIK
jgi:FAD/FMN-containing dehydrogenase/uncharacterized membrane protein YhaH (DUF805 family)